jgi:hypothetical protein
MLLGPVDGIPGTMEKKPESARSNADVSTVKELQELERLLPFITSSPTLDPLVNSQNKSTLQMYR